MPRRGPRMTITAPAEVEALHACVARFMDTTDTLGRKIGNAPCGVYAFYDYDGEPIYVGETKESLRTRIRRHLTNQRTDAVAMNVLDPFEVAEIEVWPMFDLAASGLSTSEVKARLAAAEYTVYQQALAAATFHAVLNEKDIAATNLTTLPESFKARIVPDETYELRKHADVRIARRAATIASLAKVISERKVSKGLRRTFVTQAKRLLHLAEQRLGEVPGGFPVETPGEDN